jgi:hypothetical protein
LSLAAAAAVVRGVNALQALLDTVAQGVVLAAGRMFLLQLQDLAQQKLLLSVRAAQAELLLQQMTQQQATQVLVAALHLLG